ncbi:hypothetical protein ACFP3Q_05665 [Nocardioides sp. GCM10027113]|uniref:hypothetical protein n=1 Tax=unclassified Nocardioides TaxID=2615069 RepID=UPI003623A2FF
MRLPPLPDPRDLLRDGVQLVERVTGLLGTAEELVASAGRVMAAGEELLGRIDGLVDRIEATRAAADEVVAATDTTRQRADALIERFEPSLTALQPTLDRLAETTDPREVDAMVALIDQLPLLAAKMETDVIPVLNSLTTVAPDLHDLLDTSRELNEMLAKLPGMGRIRKRVDDQQEAEGRG